LARAATLRARTSLIISGPGLFVRVEVEVGAVGGMAAAPMRPSKWACRAVAKFFIAVIVAAGTHPPSSLSSQV
jgi:hypothetical protein